MSGSDIVIRPSREGDIAEIAAIYRHHVLHGLASFEEIPPGPDEVAGRRRNILTRGLPYLVAERSGRVLGYCYAGPYRSRSAYRFTLEDSIYIDNAEVGRGIGRALLSQPCSTAARTRLSADGSCDRRQRYSGRRSACMPRWALYGSAPCRRSASSSAAGSTSS